MESLCNFEESLASLKLRSLDFSHDLAPNIHDFRNVIARLTDEQLTRALNVEFSANAMKVFSERYAGKRPDGTKECLPAEMYVRVARALSQVSEKDKEYFVEFLRVMVQSKFVPAGRTLANAGLRDVVSNCIVLHFDDTMESIFETLGHGALLQKWGSGLGFPFHLLRPAGYNTRSAEGVASGPVSFLRMYDACFNTIKQQGRHGANMAVMRVDHPDILEFISCKAREGDIRNFNISVAYTDEFMRRACNPDDNEPWYCNWKGERMLPRRIMRNANFAFERAEPVRMSPREILMEVSEYVWRNGEPGHIFIDTVNETNPLPKQGRIEACNPCGMYAIFSALLNAKLTAQCVQESNSSETLTSAIWALSTLQTTLLARLVTGRTSNAWPAGGLSLPARPFPS